MLVSVDSGIIHSRKYNSWCIGNLFLKFNLLHLLKYKLQRSEFIEWEEFDLMALVECQAFKDTHWTLSARIDTETQILYRDIIKLIYTQPLVYPVAHLFDRSKTLYSSIRAKNNVIVEYLLYNTKAAHFIQSSTDLNNLLRYTVQSVDCGDIFILIFNWYYQYYKVRILKKRIFNNQNNNNNNNQTIIKHKLEIIKSAPGNSYTATRELYSFFTEHKIKVSESLWVGLVSMGSWEFIKPYQPLILKQVSLKLIFEYIVYSTQLVKAINSIDQSIIYIDIVIEIILAQYQTYVNRDNIRIPDRKTLNNLKESLIINQNQETIKYPIIYMIKFIYNVLIKEYFQLFNNTGVSLQPTLSIELAIIMNSIEMTKYLIEMWKLQLDHQRQQKNKPYISSFQFNKAFAREWVVGGCNKEMFDLLTKQMIEQNHHYQFVIEIVNNSHLNVGLVESFFLENKDQLELLLGNKMAEKSFTLSAILLSPMDRVIQWLKDKYKQSLNGSHYGSSSNTLSIYDELPSLRINPNQPQIIMDKLIKYKMFKEYPRMQLFIAIKQNDIQLFEYIFNNQMGVIDYMDYLVEKLFNNASLQFIKQIFPKSFYYSFRSWKVVGEIGNIPLFDYLYHLYSQLNCDFNNLVRGVFQNGSLDLLKYIVKVVGKSLSVKVLTKNMTSIKHLSILKYLLEENDLMIQRYSIRFNYKNSERNDGANTTTTKTILLSRANPKKLQSLSKLKSVFPLQKKLDKILTMSIANLNPLVITYILTTFKEYYIQYPHLLSYYNTSTSKYPFIHSQFKPFFLKK